MQQSLLVCVLALALPRLYGQGETQYPVTFSATAGGSVSVSCLVPYGPVKSGDLVAAGAELTVFGIADEGYQLDYWEINGVRSSTTDYSFSVENLQAPLNIVGHFKRLLHAKVARIVC